MNYDGFSCMGERGTKYVRKVILKESNVFTVSNVRKVNLIYGRYEYICVISWFFTDSNDGLRWFFMYGGTGN